MIQYILGFAVLLVVLLYLKLFVFAKKGYTNYVKKLKELNYRVYEIPYNPAGFPLLDNFPKLEKEHKDAFYNEKNIYPNYDVVVSNVLAKPLLILTSAQLVKQLLVGDKIHSFPKTKNGLEMIYYLQGNSVVFTEQETWRRKRKLLKDVFNFGFVKAQLKYLPSICDNAFEKFESKYYAENPQKANSKEIVMDLLKMNMNIFASLILTSFFGNENINQTIDGIPVYEFANNLMGEALYLSSDPLILLFGLLPFKLKLKQSYKNFDDHYKKWNAVGSQFIEANKKRFAKKTQKEKEEDTTIIGKILLEKQKSGESAKYDDQEIIDEYNSLLVAGSDTSTNYTTMMLFYIFEHPEVQAKLRKIIAEKIKSDEDLTAEKLKEFEYLDWIQYETTRLFGPSGYIFFRESKQDQLLKDMPITKGTVLTYTNLSIHQNPEIYPDPKRFWPERWQGKKPDDWNLIGFSHGPRSCIGKQLALNTTKITLIKFLNRYKRIIEPERIISMPFLIAPKNTVAKFQKH